MFDSFGNLHHNPQFHVFTGSVSKMPGWARGILAIVALPGLVAVGLSILLLLVSILALLLLSVPAYLLLRKLTGVKVRQVVGERVSFDDAGRTKRVNVRVVE